MDYFTVYVILVVKATVIYGIYITLDWVGFSKTMFAYINHN